MSRLISLDRLAPEVKTSRTAMLLTAGAAFVVLALVVLGLVLAVVLKTTREGTSHVLFQSTEPFGTAPGARMVYVPDREAYVIRGWLFEPLGPQESYQVWAVQDGRYRSLGTAGAEVFVGFVLAGERDLSGVDVILITREPAGGSFPTPQGTIVVEMVPRT
jgi:hypothetical protein